MINNLLSYEKVPVLVIVDIVVEILWPWLISFANLMSLNFDLERDAHQWLSQTLTSQDLHDTEFCSSFIKLTGYCIQCLKGLLLYIVNSARIWTSVHF